MMMILLLAKLLMFAIYVVEGWVQNLGQEGKGGSSPKCERLGGVHSPYSNIFKE